MVRVLIAFVLVLTWASCLQAAKEIEFNVDLFCGWERYYRPMEWTPAEIGITTDLTEPFEGVFTITAQQDGLNTLNIVHNIVLTPNQPLALPLVTKLAWHVGKCTLRIRDARGRTRWEQTIDTWDFSTANRLLQVVQEEDMLIGLLGSPKFGLLRLGENAVCMSHRGPGSVYVGAKVPRMMPWDWTGFASLDVLILYDPDWSQLKPAQVKAIRDWVSNGGTMLLILGRHPLPQGSPVSDLIPFNVGELRTCQVPSGALQEWGFDASQPASVTAWSLSAKPQTRLLAKSEAPDAGFLYGMSRAGFGRAAVLAFDPAELSAGQERRSAQFWTKQIAACLAEQPGTPPAMAVPNPQTGQAVVGCTRTIVSKDLAPKDDNRQMRSDERFRIGIAQNAGNRVMEYLYQLRQMRPLSIWWVILTLSALAILLGPVDYLVLKRLDKLPYTWLTSTGWIVLFTVGAYFGVQELRGGTMQLRAISVLDSVADSNCAWATYYTGLFAPRSDEYQLDGLKPGQWWAGISPTREELYAWQREAGMRQIYCVQQDGTNLPISLPINIWTVQSLLGESPLSDGVFAASVQRHGGTVSVEIVNKSDNAIARGVVLWDDGYADFDAVPARATRTFEVPSRSFNPWYDTARPDGFGRRFPGTLYGLRTPRYPPLLGEQGENVFLAPGCLNRTLAMHTSLRFGATLVCVMFDKAPPPFGVKNRSYEVNHIQYARQLIAEPAVQEKDNSHD
jgi:hypothetical protein